MSAKIVKLEEEDSCFGKSYDENETDCQICMDADDCRKEMEKPKQKKKKQAKSKKLTATPEEYVVKENLISYPEVITKNELKELHGMLLTYNLDCVVPVVKNVKKISAGRTLVGNKKRSLSGYMDSLGLVGKYTLEEMVKKLEVYNKVKKTKGDLKRRIINHFKFIEDNRESVDRVEINNGVYKIILK